VLGAIAGDVIGSVHEFAATKTKEFPLLVPESHFTDDTVLTVAIAEWILTSADLVDLLHDYTASFPGRGYGLMYGRWANNRWRDPYHSFGNGSAMRVSPVGFAFETLEEVLQWAERSAAVTHNHPEGIRGAQAAAAAVFWARQLRDKTEIRCRLAERFGYDLGFTLDAIRPTYRFNETCQDTVPQALVAFLESTGYEDAVRNAVSLGGDADTLACVTGGVAEAYYGVPENISRHCFDLLDDRLAAVVRRFRDRFRLG